MTDSCQGNHMRHRSIFRICANALLPLVAHLEHPHRRQALPPVALGPHRVWWEAEGQLGVLWQHPPVCIVQAAVLQA